MSDKIKKVARAALGGLFLTTAILGAIAGILWVVHWIAMSENSFAFCAIFVSLLMWFVFFVILLKEPL